MKLQDLSIALIIAVFAHSITSLEHEKSFLAQDGTANVHCLGIYKNSLLISSSNDVVQKDIETGAIQRTFRAHQNVIMSFVVLEDSRMISSAYDDMILVWALETGSILKRVWARASNIKIKSIFYDNEKILLGCFDRFVRQIDLGSGRVSRTIDMNGLVQQVISSGDVAFASSNLAPFVFKVSLVDGTILVAYEGHSATSFSIAVYETFLLSGSYDRSVLCWDTMSGALLKSYLGHNDPVTLVAVYDGELYSGSVRSELIRWNLLTAQIIKSYPDIQTLPIVSSAYLSQRLFAGSGDGTVIQWDIISGQPSFTYRGTVNKMRAVVSWKKFLFSGGDDAQIKVWDSSIDSFDTLKILSNNISFVDCLLISGATLYVGGSDNFVLNWDLKDFTLIRKLESPTSGIGSIALDKQLLFAGGYYPAIYRWNVSSGALLATYTGHTNYVLSIIISSEIFYSGSFDSSIRVWNINSGENFQVLNTLSGVNDALLTTDNIIACTETGLEMFSLSTSQNILNVPESLLCTTIISNGFRIFTGQSDSSIRVRDFDFLNILETYQGHLDVVTSLCFDESFILYSTGFDGSVKKWNMAARRVAFSFEIRKNSVAAIAANGNQLFVGLRRGTIVEYNIENAFITEIINIYAQSVSCMLLSDGHLYSSGLDGLLLKFLITNEKEMSILYNAGGDILKSLAINSRFIAVIQAETKIVLLPQNESLRTPIITDSLAPLLCIAATESEILAGSRSGSVYGWSIENLNLNYELKGHIAQVNHILVVDNMLFSASTDKSIIEWSLVSRTMNKAYKRLSSSALGHLGIVNSISFCYDTLFSAGADLSVRRWNTLTGRHESVYFGFYKPVTSVLCHNGSVFAGSDDFSVLMYTPDFISQTTLMKTTITPASSIRVQRRKVIHNSVLFRESGSQFNQTIAFVTIAISALIFMFFVSTFMLRRSQTKRSSPSTLTSTTAGTAYTTMDLETVVNSVIGISKHAALLLESSAIGRIRKLTAGGGGELFLVKIMDSSLKNKLGEIAVQKAVFVKSKFTQEAFYQEVGIMIMLNSFPHFCTIHGYTENPLSMILKYYPDGSLYDWIRKNKLVVTPIIKILLDTTQALNTMHSHYLAHCDFKTQNVLVEISSGVPSCYLTDFGITQVLSDSIIATKSFNTINLRGISVQYASPEAFLNFKSKRYSRADFKKYDIYSLACVLCEVLTRKTPWH
ncbi:hypothetical protein MP638_001247 [Amoeboaphelidium occidentale]|nr:hypothetical protein MP638_001247 [Amoeboaphelidium occidentale]